MILKKLRILDKIMRRRQNDEPMTPLLPRVLAPPSAMIAFLSGACCAALAAEAVPPAVAPAPAIAMHGEPALKKPLRSPPLRRSRGAKGGRLAIGFLGTFDSLNPFNLKAGSTAQGLNGNVFETLMTRSLDEPFTLYGLIAQTIETDEDRTLVTFRLDPRAHFSDGAPITSADVRFTFELLKTKGRPQQRAAYSLVKSIETPDALTIRYDLTGIDDREMPLTLALMPVLPRHKIDPAKFDDASLDIPTGSGPYIDRRRQAGPAHHPAPRSQLLGEGSAGPPRPLQFRRDRHRIFPRRQQPVRGLRGRTSRFSRGDQSGALDHRL